jgi:hypothetical protein
MERTQKKRSVESSATKLKCYSARGPDVDRRGKALIYLASEGSHFRAYSQRWPRASAALAFGAAGTALAILWWTPVIFHARGSLPFVLFIVSPAISAAFAGGALGKWLLKSAEVRRPTSAMLRGAVIGSLAILLFAPLFATLYVWTQPMTEHWSILGLAFLVLVGSVLAIWWLVALIGAMVGLMLNRLASRTTPN